MVCIFFQNVISLINAHLIRMPVAPSYTYV